MKISHVGPVLINPIWLPNSIKSFNLLACKAHNENGNGKYPGLLSQKMSCMVPQLLKIAGCLILTIEHFHNYSI